MPQYQINYEIRGAQFRCFRWQEGVVLFSYRTVVDAVNNDEARVFGEHAVEWAWKRSHTWLSRPDQSRLEIREIDSREAAPSK